MEGRLSRSGRAAALLLIGAWALLALAMAAPVAEWVLVQGFKGFPWSRQRLPEELRPILFGGGGAALVAALVLLHRLPAPAPHPLLDWHTRALRVGGILYLFGGVAALVSAMARQPSFLPPDHPVSLVIRDSRLLGAFLGCGTGSLLFAAFLARRRKWPAASPLTAAANLVLGFFFPAGTYLMVLWLAVIEPAERPPPG